MVEFGNLYLVGTPIGNLEDMTGRAIRILQTVDLIAAEDTRHTGRLLQHFQIKTPQISYHDHNRSSREQDLLAQLQTGKNIALVTDAGMPGICDPGYELVKACGEKGIKVIPIPGVSAAITALAISGFRGDRFCFEGFLSQKAKERQGRLEELKSESRTLIFYEAPHHLLQTLTDLVNAFGPHRPLVMARELTKLYEEIWRGNLGDAQDFYTKNNPRGEFTLVIEGNEVLNSLLLTDSSLKTELAALMGQGMSKSQASRHLAELSGISRRHLYQLALTID
jgi:16S rRNA (cytidine1402-2'-O)-methyltransferase